MKNTTTSGAERNSSAKSQRKTTRANTGDLDSSTTTAQRETSAEPQSTANQSSAEQTQESQQKRSAGRPPIFSTPEQMQEAVDQYFESLSRPLMDKQGNAVLDKEENPIMIPFAAPPTMTGLSLALGFYSRNTLYEYEGNPVFTDTVSRARARVVAYAESRLFDRDGANGAKFALANYRDDWVDRTEQTINTNVVHQIDEAAMDRLWAARQARIEAEKPAIEGGFDVIS